MLARTRFEPCTSASVNECSILATRAVSARAVHEYSQGRNRSAAENVTARMRSTIAWLREMPLLGKQTDEADVHVIVEPEYPYRVFYRVGGQQVLVIRIRHGRQI